MITVYSNVELQPNVPTEPKPLVFVVGVFEENIYQTN